MSTNKTNTNRINLSELLLKRQEETESNQPYAGSQSMESSSDNSRGVAMLQQEAEKRKREVMQRQEEANRQEALMRQQEADRRSAVTRQQEEERQITANKQQEMYKQQAANLQQEAESRIIANRQEAERNKANNQQQDLNRYAAANMQEAERRAAENRRLDSEWHKQEAASYQQEGFKRQRYSMNSQREAQVAKPRKSMMPRLASRSFFTLLMLSLVGSVMAFLAYKNLNDGGRDGNSTVLVASETSKKIPNKPAPSTSRQNTVPAKEKIAPTLNVEADATKTYTPPVTASESNRPSLNKEVTKSATPAAASIKTTRKATASSNASFEADTDEQVKKLQYVVKSKAFIHTKPAADGRTAQAIAPVRSMAPFNGLSEENGYVYVVVQQGRNNYEGWVKKQSLKPVTTVFYSSNEKN